MSTQALTAEYRKVVPAQYVEKRDGSPMACMTCGTNLVMGQAFAATHGQGWHSYCARCAADPKAQIAGLVARIEALVEPLANDAQVLAPILNLVAIATPAVEKVLAGNTDNGVFLDAKTRLFTVREAIGVAKRQATPDPLIDALRAIAPRNGFANSLVAWFDKHGSLTTNQRSAAERLVAEQAAKAERLLAQAAAQTPKVLVQVAVGLYRSDDGTVRRAYKTSRGRIACRKYNGVRFVYEGYGGLQTIAEGLDKGTTRLLTAAEASAFGKGIGRCFNCMSIGRPGHLSDDRSLAVGYGETCATHNGWWYPSADEAGKILHGSFDLDAKLTQALAPAVDVDEAVEPGWSEELGDLLDDEQDIEDRSPAHEAAAFKHGGTLILDEFIEDDDEVADSFAGALVPGEGEAFDDEGGIIPVYDTKVEHGIEAPPVAAVVTPECAWCHEAPGTLSFVCEGAEAHRVCPTCRPVLVAGNRCPFHNGEGR